MRIIILAGLLGGFATVLGYNVFSPPDVEAKKPKALFNIQALIDPYKVTKTKDGLNVFLTGSIVGRDSYLPLIKKILDLPEGSKVNLYLAGNGGSVASTVSLINALHLKKHVTKAYVYGNVYSAHAVLAVSMDRIVTVGQHIMFLFHIPAISNSDGEYEHPMKRCEKMDEDKKDRGVSSKKKCIDFTEKYMKAVEASTFKMIKVILTPNEYLEYKKGDDIILYSGEIIRRLRAHHR